MTRASFLVALAAMAVACRGPVELAQERPIAAVAPGAAVPASPVRPSSTATPTLSSSYRGAAATPTGVVVPVLGTSTDGWLVGTPCGRAASVRNVRALTGTVVLDAGHGGEETGAIGPLGHKESALNAAVVAHARRALQAAGISAVLTRTDDYRIGIAPRAAIVGAVKPKAVVSIHHNASSSEVRDSPGTEIFHQAVGASAAESRRLAGLLYEEVTATLAHYDVTGWAATGWAGVKPRHNAAGDDFYGMLRRTQGTPTALVEVGFVSHEAEERLYARPAVQQAVGEAVARGVVRFLTTADPGRGFVDPPRQADDNRPGGGTENCQDPSLG
ncbi:MAG TPA: N-acetylmuramoyl-L-alanine amidase [Acidimicrobiia bacterium]|nr:N-acetylmuramoyl-L-alanine amidase [Acidimicrobiia bacterium]